MHTPSCDRIPSPRRQLPARGLSRVATSALLVAALAFVSWTTVAADSRAGSADRLPASSIADVVRGGAESGDDDRASVDALARVADEDASTTTSRRAPGGRSCSTLVLQHGES